MGSAKHAGVMDPQSYRLEQRIAEIEKTCTEVTND